MATASTMGAWHSGGPSERPYSARAPRVSAGAERPGRPVRSGPSPLARADERTRGAERAYARDRFDQSHPAPPRRRDPAPGRPSGARPSQVRSRERAMAAPGSRDSKLPGAIAVVGVFLLTLAGGAVDSFVGMGLGMITLIALAAGVSVATLLVRRRDLLTVIVAPPLIFMLVAMVNISLAPSATFNLPTMATLLVRGFPTMAVATVIAVVLAAVRLVTRR